MSEFDIAAHEAVNSVQPFIDALDEAERECQEAVRYVQTLGERLTEDRHALQEAVAALQHEAEEDYQVLAGQAAGATANLGRVAQAVAAAVQEWDEVLEREDQALVGASELLPELGQRVQELAEKADAASHGVLELANHVSEQLEQAVQAVEHLVGVGLVTMVAEWRSDAEEAVHRLLEFFETECGELLNTKEVDWKDKLHQLHDLLDHAFEAIATHQQEVATYTAEKWVHLLEAQIESTQTEAHALADALSSLSQATTNFESELQVAAEMVGDHQQQASEGAAKLEQGLFEVRGRWATFGITC